MHSSGFSPRDARCPPLLGSCSVHKLMGRIICSRFGDSLLGLLTPSPASPPQLLSLVARHGGRRHPHVPGMPSAVIAHIPSIGNSHLWHRPSSRLSRELSRREERSRNYKALGRCSASPPAPSHQAAGGEGARAGGSPHRGSMGRKEPSATPGLPRGKSSQVFCAV